ncbi:TonB-dependent siderophore receptor [Phytopseudomonas daroniae]|uniref:TonB-dependent siderophore receptor n=1 Tax=Phytopseudomonas daroniae TaxID=2487519 RepID=UPI0010384097|nr:TonB-dependent siderophore receptor [Pseudomonas daroniae]TBU75440.1 TonB-dependent siderophore receptor [Pseudomonas daroniae]
MPIDRLAPSQAGVIHSRCKPLLLASAIGCAILGSNWAQAQEPAVITSQNQTYDIPAQPLDAALVAWSQSSGLQLFADANLTRGLRSAAVQGMHSPTEALQLLLAGTGLIGHFTAIDRVVLDKAPQQGSALELGGTTILGARGPVAEGSGSYTTTGSTTAVTKLALTAKETPQSVSVITRQRLDDQKLDSVTDVLDATVGVTTFNQGIGTDLNQPYSRGFIISNYLVDGLPRSSGRIFNLQSGTAMFDRVEVVRGATGLMSGMGNPGASINLIRKRPTIENQASISAEAGSWDRYGLGTDLSGSLNEAGNIRSRLVVDYKDQNSWLDRYESRSQLVYGITEFDLSDETLLSVGFSHQANDNESPMRSGVPLYYSDNYRDGIKINLPRSYNNAPDWSYYDTKQSNLFVSLDHQFGNGWNGKVEVSHTRYEQDAISYYQYGGIDPATGLGSSIAPVKWEQTDKQNSLDAYVTGPFSLGGREHELVTGIAFSRTDGKTNNYDWLYSWNSDYDGTLGDIWEWDGSGANRPVFDKLGKTDTEETQYSAYLTSRFNLTDATSLIVGSRVIDWKRTADTTTSAGVRSTSEKKESGVVVPFAGLIYALDDIWSLYGSYTQIFNPQSATARDINNSPLDPEEGSTYEVGIKAGFYEGQLNASLALFRVEQDNVAEYDSTISAYRALQGITTEGVELELNGEISEGWNIAGGYAYSLSEDADGNRAMSRIPRHNVKAFSTYRLSGNLEKFTVGAGFNWKSTYGYEGDGYPEQGSYVLVNAMTRYDISKQLSATVNVNNLFDKKYYASLTENGVYGEPRNAILSVKYQF